MRIHCPQGGRSEIRSIIIPKKIVCFIIGLFSTCALSMSLPQDAFSEPPTAAIIFSLQGSASVVRAGATMAASDAMQVQEGDEIVVGEPGRVALKLNDGSYVRLPAGARLRFPTKEQAASISGQEDKGAGALGLIKGALHFFSHSEKHPTVITDHVTAAIRGTEFTALVDAKSTSLNIVSGAVEGSSKIGKVTLKSGDGAQFSNSAPPQLYKLVSAGKNVQWSLFVPFLGEADLVKLSSNDQVEVDLIKSSSKGDISAALKAGLHGRGSGLAPDPCSVGKVLRGRSLILSGDADQGAMLLNDCVDSKAGSKSNARGEINRTFAGSILSLVRLYQGRGDDARSVLGRLGGSSDLAIYKLANSFVLQDRGDLEGALAALGEQQDRESGDIVARRAELAFMFGDVPKAREILESLSDPSWYAKTVKGFVVMADRDFGAAKYLFEEAASLQPGAGLPQLGLGLIAVNNGNLEEGRNYFERATVLEPSRSLFRSYLAKSYFESDNYAPAAPEYERAIELDPNDPTPHLYRSFMQLAENQPVDALHSLEKARALSDNRSVYRSKFLLDEDAAVQSASLSRTYRDLGFNQRGKIEAISAIVSDYKNASAHRLLAETQESVSSAEASLSERRMADLFAPLSINVVDSIGANVSLNEYSSLFERDGWRTGVSSGYSSLGDLGSTGVIAANKSGNFVTGLTASGTVQNGFKDEPGSREGRAGISFQSQPTWADRFLVEAKGTFGTEQDAYRKDVAQGSNDKTQFDMGSFTGAYLHKFNPDITSVLQTHYERARELTSRGLAPDDLLISVSEQGEVQQDLFSSLVDSSTDRYNSLWVNEAQLIGKTDRLASIFTLRSATSHLDSYDEREVLQEETGILEGQSVTLGSQSPSNLQSEVVSYLGTINLTEELFLNLGGAYEHLEWSASELPPFANETLTHSRVSPKAGVIYKPSSAMMWRIGYGESVGKGFRADLASLEPTLIGGITQRFNDLPGTFSKNLGIGVDVKPLEDSYFGAEWTRRWLEESQATANYSLDIDLDMATIERGVGSVPPFFSDVNQDFVNSYWYQVLTRQLVVGTDYRYLVESIDLGDSKLTDHRAKAFSRYFLTNGLFLQTSATYRYQDRINNPVVNDGASAGWLFGAGLGYRLPARGGLILAEIDNVFGEDLNLDQTNYFNDLVASDPLVRLSATINF